MPDFPIIDAHIHLWDQRRLSYPWLSGNPALNRNFLIDDFRAASGSVAVEKIVFVQCDCVAAQAMAEAEWVAGIAKQEPRLGGIVARAALEKGELTEAHLAKLSTIPLVKGVRRLIQGEADPEFPSRATFVRAIQMLPRFGFSFDLCLKHHQLRSTIELVGKCPNVQFVLDHIGKPDIKAGQLDPWRADIRELSRMENVWCKISGVVTEADWGSWTQEDLRPYIEHIISCFGFDRVMFGSDWPVSTLATEYRRWVATLDELLRDFSRQEREKFFSLNAKRVYRLG